MDPTINPQVQPTISSCSSCRPACSEEPLQLETEAMPEGQAPLIFFPNNSGFIRFRVRALHAAHIALTMVAAAIDPMYLINIGIGGFATTMSAITKNGKNLAFVSTPGILDPNEFRGFWIRWENCTISVGREYEVPPFMGWTESQRINIEYIGIRTQWGAKGSWIIEPTRVPAHYWKDFDGIIPYDAVPASKDNLYIGQGLAQAASNPLALGFFPVGIRYMHELTPHLPYGNPAVRAINFSVKVLCSTNPERFHWIPTNGTSYANDMMGRNPIVGGWELNPGRQQVILHIGRCSVNGQYFVGKIFTNPADTYLEYVGPGNSYSIARNFEALVVE